MLDWLAKRQNKPLPKHKPYDVEVVECENGLGDKFYIVRYWKHNSDFYLTSPEQLNTFKSAQLIQNAYKFSTLKEAQEASMIVEDWKKEYLRNQIIEVKVY